MHCGHACQLPVSSGSRNANACLQALRRGRLDDDVRVVREAITDRCHPARNWSKEGYEVSHGGQQYGLFKQAGKSTETSAAQRIQIGGGFTSIVSWAGRKGGGSGG